MMKPLPFDWQVFWKRVVAPVLAGLLTAALQDQIVVPVSLKPYLPLISIALTSCGVDLQAWKSHP